MNKEMHLHEDTAKPENRVNLALFHLMMIDEFAAFIKNKLNIPAECCIYPAPNLETEEFDTCERPDFKIELDGALMGYIEVELGNEDQSQLAGYREKINEPVYSIVGKKSYLRGDLALDEIYDFASGMIHKYKGGQKFWSLKLLTDLINYYVIQGNFNDGNKRSAISEQMRNSALIKAMFEYFGADRIIENQKVQRNKIMLNTVTENGFSVRVFSPETGTGGLSVMSRSGGRETIGFPSYKKLCKYLPEKIEFVDKYAALISALGAPEIMRLDENKLARLDLKTVEDNSTQFFDIISELIDARKYSAVKSIPCAGKINDGVVSEPGGEPAEEGNELKHLPTGYLSVVGKFINFIENTSRQKDPGNPLEVVAVYFGKTGRLWSRNMKGPGPNYFIRCSNGLEINNRMDSTGYNKSKCVGFSREEFDKELKKR